VKEIGGYFELELSRREEYHSNIYKLNSGRNAFKFILEAEPIEKIYIPTYICNSMIEPLVSNKINYQFYTINSVFEINEIIELKENEKILYVNYFALKSKYISKLIEIYSNNLIIDNTQAFFEKPLKDIDTIYSPRKFFGVSDGGYLSTNKNFNNNLMYDTSFENSKQLFGRIDGDASLFYSDYQLAEQRLIDFPIMKMSKLTEKILSSIDYEKIKLKRKENFIYLHNALKEINDLNIDLESINIPFVYPLLINNSKLREVLIKNKIYVAKYWNEVLNRDNVSKTEINLVNNLIPIPLDQRYDLEDMKRITEIIIKEVK